MDYWVIIPDEIVHAIENQCLNRVGKFTPENLLVELNKFVNEELEKYDAALYQHYYNTEIIYLKEDTLKRALNKRPDNGVYIKKNKKLLDLLCWYAFTKSWERTLKKLRIEFKDIHVRNSKQKNLSKQVLGEINSLINEKGDYALILIHKALSEIKDEMSVEGYITVDVGEISNKTNEILEYKINSLKSFSALTNALYYYLVEFIKPYTYGYDWVLINSKTKHVLKSIRMLSGSPPGIRMPDLRTLEDLGIEKGMHLIAIKLNEKSK